MKLMKVLLAFSFLALAAGPVAAGSTNTTMNVTATVVNNCTVGATDLVFGDYTGVVEVESSFVVSVTCTDPTDVTLDDDGGNNIDIDERRQMTGPDGGTELLKYKVCFDAICTTEWLDSNQYDTNTDAFPLTLYGKLPAGDTPGTGGYTDVLTWTLSW